MDLTNVSTRELVEELARRERNHDAVEVFRIDPYEPYSIGLKDLTIEADGPAVVIRIWD